jgi:hypothetical protein
MWVIVSFVTALEFFGPRPHMITSVRHFVTEEACEAYRTVDAFELIAELSALGLTGLVDVDSHCELDTDGEPL